VILTPSAKSTPAAINKIEQLWDETGACVEMMDAATHDAILARSSHLPQAVSSVLAAALNTEKIGDKLALEYGAGGLRDTTRLAASSWEIWRDIFVTNREAIAAALKLYGGTFAEFSARSKPATSTTSRGFSSRPRNAGKAQMIIRVIPTTGALATGGGTSDSFAPCEAGSGLWFARCARSTNSHTNSERSERNPRIPEN